MFAWWTAAFGMRRRSSESYAVGAAARKGNLEGTDGQLEAELDARHGARVAGERRVDGVEVQGRIEADKTVRLMGTSAARHDDGLKVLELHHATPKLQPHDSCLIYPTLPPWQHLRPSTRTGSFWPSLAMRCATCPILLSMIRAANQSQDTVTGMLLAGVGVRWLPEMSTR